MTQGQRLWIDEYQLILFEKDRLVKVSRSSFLEGASATVLPGWTLQSKNTIWLTDENVPIQIRASRGEQIKKKIIGFLQAR